MRWEFAACPLCSGIYLMLASPSGEVSAFKGVNSQFLWYEFTAGV